MFEIRIPVSMPHPDEPYMTFEQLTYFRGKLLSWRAELSFDYRNSLKKMNEPDSRPIEEMERSAHAVDREIDLYNQTRLHQLIRRIDEALDRIELGTYGYCEETDEPIGLDRLEASPVASYCLSVQEQLELKEKKLKARIY
ncbi:MAG: TraR/DksA family transcriptional regulator [Desulfobacteraceae bacterium]|jgi:DnaK suppressor protein